LFGINNTIQLFSANFKTKFVKIGKFLSAKTDENGLFDTNHVDLSRCPFQKGKGGLMPDGFVDFPKQYIFSRGKRLSPFGDIVFERSEW